MLARRFGRPGLVGLAARTAVVAGTAGAVQGGIARHQQQQAEQAELQAYEQQRQQAQAVAASGTATPDRTPSQSSRPGDDAISQLERLAALRKSQVLTDEEFATQKARILQNS